MQPCLRDIWHDHVLFTGDEVSGIIDYGAMDIDTPATDIARLLGNLVGDDALKWRVGIDTYSQVCSLMPEEERAIRALDASGLILAGCNWLRWIGAENRQFENRAQIVARFRRIVERCEFRAAR
jgi:homoserine kinase type II